MTIQLLKNRLPNGLVIFGILFGCMFSANAGISSEPRPWKEPPWVSMDTFYLMYADEEKAEQGDVEMQYLVAETNYTGIYKGTEVGEYRTKAFRFYQKAANQGHAKAQTSLAIMYLEGEVVRQSLSEHIKWLKKAAAQKNSHAQILLGVAYEFGNRGVNKDYVIAKEWYGKSCDNGNSNGCRNYKILNEQGH